MSRVVEQAAPPTIDVTVLFAGGGIGKDKDIRRQGAGTDAALPTTPELIVQLGALDEVSGGKRPFRYLWFPFFPRTRGHLLLVLPRPQFR